MRQGSCSNTDACVNRGVEAATQEGDPRLSFLARRLEELGRRRFSSQRLRVLDVGCADGSFMRIAAARLSGMVECVDGADVPSKWLDRGAAQGAGSLYVQDLQKGNDGLPAGRYHVATLWEVIEHVENVYAFLRNLKETLVPGGAVLLSTPNLLSLSRLLKGRGWVGVAETDHKYLFDAQTLEMVLTRAGLSNARARAYFFPSLGPGMDRFNGLLSALPGGGMLYAEAFKGAV
ncbi:MAG: class I SAM-dependent methyltransferase [Thermodesulfobacteriota bacterium]